MAKKKAFISLLVLLVVIGSSLVGVSFCSPIDAVSGDHSDRNAEPVPPDYVSQTISAAAKRKDRNDSEEECPDHQNTSGELPQKIAKKSKGTNRKLIRLLWRKRKDPKILGILHRVREMRKEKWDQFLKDKALHGPIPSLKHESSNKPPQNENLQKQRQGRTRRIWNRVKKIFRASASVDSAATKRMSDANDGEKDEPRKSKKKVFENFRYNNKFDTEETVAGARLLSGSFQMLSSTAGFLADAVRISGDTAASIMGSSVKIFGAAVKSVGSGLSTASRRLEKNESVERSMTDQSKMSSQLLPSWRQRQKKRYSNLGKHTRKLASGSVRLVGNVVVGIGESLLIAGVATESLTSSAAGVAEGTVRILENLAGTLSIAVSLRGRRKGRTKNGPLSQETGSLRKKLSPYFVSFGNYDNGSLFNKTQFQEGRPVEDVIQLLEQVVADAAIFWDFVSADIEDVPSIAVELLVALLLCHLAVVVLFPQRSKEEPDQTMNQPKYYDICSRVFSLSSPRGSEQESKGEKRIGSPCLQRFSNIVKSIGKLILCLPIRILKCTLQALFALLLDRRMMLLGIYGLIWTYLSRLSQQRALLIQRRSEAIGFRNGIAAITANSPGTETVQWFNGLLERLWRVKHHQQGDFLNEVNYPIYVLRAFECQVERDHYGGLEPQLSSVIGRMIVKSLDVAKAARPTDVAYVSLFSLSLGKQPPIIRYVGRPDTQRAFRGNQTRIELDLEVDALFEDMSLVLEVKLSSLSHALLPSTKIKVYNLDFRASLRATFILEPDYPFFSKIELTMLSQPECNLRATPFGNDSSLKGIDLSSMPILNDWIQDAIRTSLSSYVSPQYITIDLAAILNSDRSSFHAVSPYLESLRHRTSFSLANPRTSIPEAISIASVADRLGSHQSATQVIRANLETEDGNQNGRKPEEVLVKPVTELSRMAFERYTFKEGNRFIKPTTELSRLAMDRWLGTELEGRVG